MAHALFEVSAKAFIVQNDKILVLTTPRGHVDFPGGRLEDTEYTLPLKECLQRELSEEIGKSATYDIGNIAFVTKSSWEINGEMTNVIRIYYKVSIYGAEIYKSDEHSNLEWLTADELLRRKDAFMSMDEYERVSEYVQLHLS